MPNEKYKKKKSSSFFWCPGIISMIQLIGLTSYFVVKITLWLSSEEKWTESKALPVPLPCMSKILVFCLTESDYFKLAHKTQKKTQSISYANTVISLFLSVTLLSFPRFRQIILSIGLKTQTWVEDPISSLTSCEHHVSLSSKSR